MTALLIGTAIALAAIFFLLAHLRVTAPEKKEPLL